MLKILYAMLKERHNLVSSQYRCNYYKSSTVVGLLLLIKRRNLLMKNFVLVFLLVFISCYANPNCNSEINIDPVVLDNAAEAGINYCKLVNNCLEGDAKSIKDLFLGPKEY